MTIQSLVNREPHGCYDVGWGWYFQFGKGSVGQFVGGVYLFDSRAHALLNRNPASYAVRFKCVDAYDPKVIKGRWFLGYRMVEKRELTADEIAWFETRKGANVVGYRKVSGL